MNQKFFGAKATVYINFEGELEDLGKLFSEKLFLPEFWYKSDIVPPHEIFGMSETLGFEIWLQKSNKFENYNFEITIETGIGETKCFENSLFDLSPWFAKEITRLCELDTHFQN